MPSFRIENHLFKASNISKDSLIINSKPRPYEVEFLRGALEFPMIAAHPHPLVLIDRLVEPYVRESLKNVSVLTFDAQEEHKTIISVMRLIAGFEQAGMTRASMLFVIGGGILQDVGSFACAMYKRGIPWTYIPTTLLAQADSCIGGKCAINHIKTKNLLALFSAPRRVLIHTGFLTSLPHEALLSGMGEIFRLCLTGGAESLDYFEKIVTGRSGLTPESLEKLIKLSLSIKRAVIEHDEFELDLRRSMNLGHSIGHAIEAVTLNTVAHGVAVTLGIMIESAISKQHGLMHPDDFKRIVAIGAMLLPISITKTLSAYKLDDIVKFLQRDKKTEGNILKLVVVETIGRISFIDFPLDDTAMPAIKTAFSDVMRYL